MLELVYSATTIYIDMDDNAGLTKSMLKAIGKFSYENDCTFALQQNGYIDDMKYYIWNSRRKLTKDEIDNILKKLKEIVGDIKLYIEIQDTTDGLSETREKLTL